LVTNDHVIEGSNELTIVVYRKATDGLRKDEYKKIRIVAMSELLDLALLKIETEPAEKFVTVPLGESAALVQGDPVFAIGNPMGLERTLSEGIVGVRSRLLGGQTYVQTTAPISPGNSGGPLFNRKGEVIGVNTLKVVSMGAEGLGFSIPIDRVKAFLADQEAFAFDPLNANTGFRYYPPPGNGDAPAPPAKSDS
jgi:serine protease Do